MLIGIQVEILKIQSLGLLERLLADKTTRAHILWATDAYVERGEAYERDQEMRAELITGGHSDVIKNRARKALEQQSERTRSHAEVFTPLWICRKMNDYADETWFGRADVFFSADGKTTERVLFPKNKRKTPEWQRYVDSRRLEITCGEAPYLVSRYDVSTGESIDIEDRIGVLDRKLRVVNENAANETEWLEWAVRAFQATYGYEFQGDNLLIARLNLLLTFEDYLRARWDREPTLREYETIANIAAWNIWQMDGLTGTIPYCRGKDVYHQISMFDLLAAEDADHPPDAKPVQPNCRIYDWRKDNSLKYSEVHTGGKSMKFDFVIGNPPYQEDTKDTSDKPVYNYFMDEAYKIAERVELISPARFLFNAGKTPKAWNEKMLADEHLKVLWYEQVSNRVFANTDIKGGIAVTYRDAEKNFGAIGVFSAFKEIRNIQNKVKKYLSDKNLSDIMILQNRFNLNSLYADFPEYMDLISSNGKERRIVSSAFDKLSIFHSEKECKDDVQILGITGPNKREYKWVNKKYVEDNGNLYKYKVFVPKANGSGAIGEVLSTPVIGLPVIGHTQSFISIGCFETELEASACLKYIKSKFARTLLGVLKITQDNPPDKWRFVPLQDFTPSSDIDWSRSVADIDKQLYAKYGLSAKEIDFIESHVKEME